MTKHKTLAFPDIKPKFKEGRVPAGFVNDIRGWTFSRLEVEDAARTGKLLTLDIDLAGKGTCSLRCGHCFRRTAAFKTEKRMDLAELMKHMREAKALGLKSVKLIGPGEPLEEKGLLDFIRSLCEMDIIPLIFTKGHILGDDSLSQGVHGMDGRALAKALKDLDVSILLGTTSFDPATEDATVGRVGYHARRHEAIKRLDEAGFNEFIPGQPTRLAFVCTPLSPANIDEAFAMYEFARTIHAQPILAPTMVAGRALGRLCEMVPDYEELLELYVKINLLTIELGITTPEEIVSVGITAYAGAAPCNQVAVGMFLRGDGKVLRCPGDDISIQGDLHEQSLTEIWAGSENRRIYAGQYNNGCPPKEGKSFPDGFFETVLGRLKDRFGV
jgi:MoaA/NifB/PqqE/SkfB family radical SAM enzyme